MMAVSRWCVCSVGALAACVFLLEGCGGGGDDPNLPVGTTTTATTTTMTTTTVTTLTGPGGCYGASTDHILPNAKPVWCFCFYTGGCLNHFQCRDEEPLEVCQKRWCGVKPVQVDEMAVSFVDVKHSNDLLTIPKLWYLNIVQMYQACGDKGQANLEMLLDVGRKAFINNLIGGGQPPEWQCVHLPGHIAVGWLHVHNFIGAVGGEKLPGVPPLAACAKASLSVSKAAAQILMQAKPHLEMLANSTFQV